MFMLNAQTGYFQHHGVDIMCFDDFYPSGRQSGVSLIQHGNRKASNGDLRYNTDRPQGWSYEPTQGKRVLNEETNTITTSMHFAGPEEQRIDYCVSVTGVENGVKLAVDFNKPAPAGLHMEFELYPGAFFSKPYIMDGKHGMFPHIAQGPDLPYATGRKLTIQPNDPLNRITIEGKNCDIHVYDGRIHSVQGWFRVYSIVPEGATTNAIEWLIAPNVVESWLHTPVVQMSQVGYHPVQPKTVIVELDRRDTTREPARLYKIDEGGEREVCYVQGEEWGQFLRYNYLKFNFNNLTEPGLYRILYGTSESPTFSIAEDVYDRGIWQPVLEYFLPVQMCHMRVRERSRIWHGLCHMDDAKMAPTNHKHFDGYEQGSSTLTDYQPGDYVPGLNIGGWHDAGDDDLRTESQAGEVYILSLAYECFDVYIDNTSICQETRVVSIHEPDGENDILQQIEHGLLSVVSAYYALGRLYRGIITNDFAQYCQICDFSVQTDNVISDDDRWVFTEDNPMRELTTAAQLAAAARCMQGFNDELAKKTLQASEELYAVARVTNDAERAAKVHAACELFLTVKESDKLSLKRREDGELCFIEKKAVYRDFLLSEVDFITRDIIRCGWYVARVDTDLADAAFSKAIRAALPTLKEWLAKQSAETPYGIPYRPHIWGAGWEIQRLGFQYYFLHKAYPEIFGPDMVYNSLNFVLGCHPGSNNTSFASGVGEKSPLVAFGHNRADYSFIPGGVISGTALIRPDFPELLDFPFLWQQTEYVLGGGSSHYMFLVLAAQSISKGDKS